MALGRAIRRYRSERSYSQETLADESGLHRTYVGGIERGERNPSYTNLVKIAEALGMRTSELLAEAERIGGESLAERLAGTPLSSTGAAQPEPGPG